jgi:hypothetical protein
MILWNEVDGEHELTVINPSVVVITTSAHVGVASFEIKISIPRRSYRLWSKNSPCYYSPKYGW